MTVTPSETRVSYNGNGSTTVFAYGYKFFQNADLIVYLVKIADETDFEQLVLDTDYTVTGAGEEYGGEITLSVAPANTHKVVIVNDPAIIQDKDYVNADDFPADSHEEALDRLTKIAQRTRDLLDRSLRISDVSDEEVPDVSEVMAASAAAIASASAAATSETNAATSETAAASSASAASTSATAASGSASAASTSATAASASATAAGNSATAAAGSASTASTQATNASASATAAAGSATTASTQATNASASATAAGNSATAAAGSASTASTQAALAQDWATKTSGTVDGLEYSAKHYAQVAAVLVGRERLAANRTYYVRTDGNDSNTGTANTAGGAWLTLQKAADYVMANIDMNGFNVTVNVGDGTYSEGVRLQGGEPVGGGGNTALSGGRLTFAGNAASPGNVIVTSSTGYTFRADQGARFAIKDLEVRSTGGGNILAVGTGAAIWFNNLRFGTCVNDQVRAGDSASVTAEGNYSIVGGGGAHIGTASGGVVRVQNRTVTLTGTPAFSNAFASADFLSAIFINGNTFTGSATGKRYAVNACARIQTGGATLPGSVAGTQALGGQIDSATWVFAADIDSTVRASAAEVAAGTDTSKLITPKALADAGIIGVPTGATIYVNGTAAPAGFLKENGALLSRTTYSALWAYAQASGNLVTDAAWSAGNRGAFSEGDGSTTFRIPDARGVHIRSYDDGAGVDSGRVLGAYQADAVMDHGHAVNSGTGYTQTGASAAAYGQSAAMQAYAPSGLYPYTSKAGGSGVTTAAENRVKNVAKLACIKY